MKNIIVFVLVAFVLCWSVPKPMESIESYNVLMIHGAYGQEEGFVEDAEIESDNGAINYKPSAYDASGYLGDASLGGYGNEKRITKWLSDCVFEEPSGGENRNPHKSYIYIWRSFANPANSSHNNAYELGDRRWSLQGTNYKKRRALTEEAQEVKARIYSQREIGDSVVVDSTVGQVALEIIRKDSDLYRQLASRYILIGHSMGGVVSREYVQSDFYNDDVDKVITLDSPHEGTGALNMLIKKSMREESALCLTMESLHKITCIAEAVE